MSNPSITVRPNVASVVVRPTPTRIVEVGSPNSSGSSSYDSSFTQADLSIANILPVTHGLNTYPSAVTIWNASGESILPDRLEVLTDNAVAIDLSSFAPLAGTWRVSIGG
ncbi:hypothetical protein [Pantanalinema sp. GBBB05]|uniref:hypothetical protein n=1 Tax=Pantanalinema sp. GBBB05 TaxID=2604139 RepID=UPI001D76665B|nr:hypothetical protein [Pantanalinema sp. GBBB05]